MVFPSISVSHTLPTSLLPFLLSSLPSPSPSHEDPTSLGRDVLPLKLHGEFCLSPPWFPEQHASVHHTASSSRSFVSRYIFNTFHKVCAAIPLGQNDPKEKLFVLSLFCLLWFCSLQTIHRICVKFFVTCFFFYLDFSWIGQFDMLSKSYIYLIYHACTSCFRVCGFTFLLVSDLGAALKHRMLQSYFRSVVVA